MSSDPNTESHVLEKGVLGLRYLAAQSIGNIAPLGAVLFALIGSIQYAYGSFPLAILIAMIVSIFWVNIPYQFSKKLAGAGGFYHYTSEALGPTYGFVTAWLYIMYYFFFIAVGGLNVFGLMVPTLLSLIGAQTPWWIPPVLGPVLLIIAAIPPLLGIRPSLKYVFVGAMLEIAFLVGISIYLIPHGINTPLVFTPALSPTGFSGVLLGAIYGFTAIGGIASVVYLGEEAKKPIHEIRRVLTLSYILAAVTFVLTAYAITVAWGPTQMASAVNMGIPLAGLAMNYLGVAGLVVLTALAINSVVVVTVDAYLATSRIFYALSRDGMLPRSFMKLNRRKSPYIALLSLLIGSLIISELLYAVFGAIGAVTFMFLMAGVSSLIAHMMGGVALPAFFRKIRSLNWLYHVVLPAIFIGSGIAIGYSLFVPFVFPVYLSPVLIVIWVLAALYIASRVKRGKGSAWKDMGKAPVREELQS